VGDKTEKKVQIFVLDIDASEGTSEAFNEESKQYNNNPTFERANNR
jgi:hypothetical protein